jgi:hypothetical protein
MKHLVAQHGAVGLENSDDIHDKFRQGEKRRFSLTFLGFWTPGGVLGALDRN